MQNLLDNSLVDEHENITNHANMAKPNLFDELVDQYKLEKHLAQGGVTDIYLAYDVDENRQVVVEILLPYLVQNKTYTDRFMLKMRQVAQFKHRHIAQVLQVGTTPFNNRPYFAREHFEAFTLRERLQQLKQQDSPVNSVYALKLVRQIAEALSLAEKLEIFHHDLQPEKVLLQLNGNVVLADLGIPRLKNIGNNGKNVYQNPNYWSPEQIQGKTINGRSHVYSLGVILFELLTGKLPATAESLWGSVKPSPNRKTLDQLRQDLSNETYRLVTRALRNPQWARYANCKELIIAIDDAIKAEEFLISAGVTDRRRSIQSLWIKFAAPLLVMVILAGIGLLLFQNSNNENLVVSGTTLTSAAVPDIASIPTATQTPTPTQTPAPVITNITIFEPAQSQEFERTGTVTFSWSWPEPLESDEQFLVQVFSPEQNFVVSRVLESDDDLTYKATVPGSAFRNGIGTYEWQVVLISPDSGSPIAQSMPREIIIIEQMTDTPEPSITPTLTTMPSSTPLPTATMVPEVQVIVSSASLREGPGTHYNVITFLREGDVVTVIGINREGGNWYNVILEDETLGWLAISVAVAVDDTAVTTIPTAATIPASPTPTNTPTSTPTLTPTPVPPSSDGGGNGGNGGSTPTRRPTLTPPPP